MTRYRVVILEGAERDLQELRGYILKTFGTTTWRTTYAALKATIQQLETFPLAGAIPDEFAGLHLTQYRQVISGMNRIVYETREQTVFIHLIGDTRRNLQALLTRRLLRGA